MRNLPFNLCIAFLVGFLMNFGTPAFSSPTPTPTATIIPTPTVRATITVSATPTPQPPTVITGEAEVTCGPMPLNGTVNANGLSTTVWFEYGTVSGSYIGTSSTQTVFGRENTTVRIEIDVEYCGYFYSHCTEETTYFGSDYYYYRIAAQNSAGISYGDQKGVGRDCCIIYQISECSPMPTATPVVPCLITGTVVDALTTAPIAGATVSTDTGGYPATTDATGSLYDSLCRCSRRGVLANSICNWL